MSILTHIALFKMEIIYIYTERERDRELQGKFTRLISLEYALISHIICIMYLYT
jgi:hypothetical protein